MFGLGSVGWVHDVWFGFILFEMVWRVLVWYDFFISEGAARPCGACGLPTFDFDLRCRAPAGAVAVVA